MTTLSNEERALLIRMVECHDRTSMTSAAFDAIAAALRSIDALHALVEEACTEIAGLRAQADRDRDTIGVLMHGRDAHLKEIEQAHLKEIERLTDTVDAQREENARLRGSIKHAHGCLLDAGVTMPGDPLAGVSDGIRALEAENAALRTVGVQMSNVCFNLSQLAADESPTARTLEVMRDLAKQWDALRKEGKL